MVIHRNKQWYICIIDQVISCGSISTSSLSETIFNYFQIMLFFFLQVLIFSLRIKLKYTELTKRQCFPNIFFVITTNSFWLLLWKECLNSDGQEFYNINKTNNYLSPQIIEHKKDHNIMHVIINCLAGVIISMLD